MNQLLLLVAALVGGPLLIYVVVHAAMAMLYVVALCNLLFTVFCPELNQLVHQLFWTIVYLSKTINFSVQEEEPDAAVMATSSSTAIVCAGAKA